MTTAWWHSLRIDRPPVPGETSDEAALRHVLARLGEYAELIVRPLNMRPTSAALIDATTGRIWVRVGNPTAHVMLVIAPVGDLAGEAFFLRALVRRGLQAPQLLDQDLTCAVVPFSYLITSYTAGVRLSQVEDTAHIRLAARQIGRQLRQVHQVPAPAFGRPLATGRWPGLPWHDTLARWLHENGCRARLEAVLDPSLLARLLAVTLEHPELHHEQPMVIHGALEPATALVSVSDTVALEAIIEPGAIIGGDPFFDLALALTPSRPAAFRQGLLEGYLSFGALPEQSRWCLRHLHVFLTTADLACTGESAAIERLPRELAATLASFA